MKKPASINWEAGFKIRRWVALQLSQQQHRRAV